MEHRIGEIVIFPDGRKAEVTEDKPKVTKDIENPFCFGCIFRGDNYSCVNIAGKCSAMDRVDHKNIIYKEFKELNMKHTKITSLYLGDGLIRFIIQHRDHWWCRWHYMMDGKYPRLFTEDEVKALGLWNTK